MTRQSSSEKTPLPLAVFLMGPTASGKTGLAMELVQRLPMEIISVDSALVYRGMDIGTAKPSPEELARAPHRLIDICDPAQSYSAAQFVADAQAAMAEVSGQGKIPLLVGGTMLYFRSLLEGISNLPASDPARRAALTERMNQEGLDALHRELAQIDPQSASRIHPNDPQRLLRALEVYQASGKTLTQLHRDQAEQELPYHLLQFAIAPEQRSVLHQRIEQRFDEMLEQGFVAEVQQLFARGDLHSELPSIKSVGYRQLWQYLSGDWDLTEARYRGIVATRQLAKRQLTWLRSWSKLNWLDSLDKNCIDKALKLIRAVPN